MSSSEVEDSLKLVVAIEAGNGNKLCVRLKYTDDLGKLMDNYCYRLDEVQGSFRFIFNGNEVMAGTTPADLEMQDGDVIYATHEV